MLQKQDQFSKIEEIKLIPKINKEIYISHLKLRTFQSLNLNSKNEEDVNQSEELLNLLMKWKIYSGIKHQPSEVDYIIIMEFIIKNYSQLNNYDISHAIDLSTTNQLKVNKSSADESFSIFSPMYVGRILSAYLAYKKEIIFDTRQIVEKELLKLNPPEKKSPEENLEDTKNYIKDQYQKIMIEKYKYDDLYQLLFSFLHTNSFIIIDEKLRNEALCFAEKIMISTKDENNNETSLTKAINSLKKSIDKSINISNNVKETIDHKTKAASNYCVVKFFLDLKNIDEFINSINTTHVENYLLKKFNK